MLCWYIVSGPEPLTNPSSSASFLKYLLHCLHGKAPQNMSILDLCLNDSVMCCISGSTKSTMLLSLSDLFSTGAANGTGKVRQDKVPRLTNFIFQIWICTFFSYLKCKWFENPTLDTLSPTTTKSLKYLFCTGLRKMQLESDPTYFHFQLWFPDLPGHFWSTYFRSLCNWSWVHAIYWGACLILKNYFTDIWPVGFHICDTNKWLQIKLL